MPVQPSLICDNGAREERDANERHGDLGKQTGDDAFGSTGVHSW